MENSEKDYSHIKGWGIDADPKNDPTYPMKHRDNSEQSGYSWKRPTLQPVNEEILHSNERPNVTAVFGTATPPTGLSGMIRRFAFNYSENSYLHWLPLIMADRVNVVEGIIEDFSNGHFPNIFAEKGYPAEWKHSPTTLVTKLAVAAVVTAGLVALIASPGKKSKKKKSKTYDY